MKKNPKKAETYRFNGHPSFHPHSRERLLAFELPDVVQGAFDLLSGPDAEGWVVPRPDLGG